MNTDPLEKDIERKVCDFAKEYGMLVYKFNSEQHRSVPDRLFIPLNGRPFFVEFKRKNKRPTEAQAREIVRIRNHGVKCYVVDNIDEGRRIIGIEALGIDTEPYVNG